jgi:hypothetical protein
MVHAGDRAGRQVISRSVVVGEGRDRVKRALAWFAKVPVDDPVDRSNAFFMQFFFAFYGCMQPLNKLYILSHANLHLLMFSRSHELRGTSIPFFVDLATDVAMSASAWMGFYLIRRGLFRQGVKQFLTVVIVSAVVYFAVTGIVDTRDDSIFFVAMIIAGLMLGRRALWYVYGGILLAYFAGMTVETLYPPPLPRFLRGLYAGMPGTMYAYLAVAIVLDRSVQSLRTSRSIASISNCSGKLPSGSKPGSNCCMPRKWMPWAGLPVASRTIFTMCWASFWVLPGRASDWMSRMMISPRLPRNWRMLSKAQSLLHGVVRQCAGNC